MIIYNVTVNVDTDVSGEWLQWMKEVHIPEVMQCGIFTDHRMVRVLTDDDEGGITFAIQYTCADMDAYNNYRDNFAPALQQKTQAKYGEKLMAFRTLLQTID